jgi:hypothetical protein
MGKKTIGYKALFEIYTPKKYVIYKMFRWYLVDGEEDDWVGVREYRNGEKRRHALPVHCNVAHQLSHAS